MGIKDTDKVLEAWLATIVPTAFFFRIPVGINFALVVADMSSSMVSAFMSPSTKTGFDFVSRLFEAVARFGKSQTAEVPPSADNWKAAMGCNISEERLALLRSTSTAQNDSFEVTVTPNAILVMARDNSHYMPANREIVHHERYGTGVEGRTSVNIRDQPFTEEEIRTNCYHIVGHRKLPGMRTDTEPADNISVVRQRANRTPALRQAYQNYGPHALARMVRESAEHAGSVKGNNKRSVVIDSVLADFPEGYECSELMDLPAGWASGRDKRYVIHQYALDGSTVVTDREPVPIGEVDLRVVWYAENMASKGDYVLIRSNDSDLLFILLSNMHLFRDEHNPRVWTRHIFLDMNTVSMKEDRLSRRFVHLNALADGLEEYAADRWPGLDHVAQVVTFLALLCGSDYTNNPPSIGPAKILSCFTESGGWRDLRELIRLGEARIEDTGVPALGHGWGNQALFSKNSKRLQLILFSTHCYDSFLRRLYQNRLTQKTIKQFSINVGMLAGWSHLTHFLSEQDKDKKNATELAVPNEIERNGDERRLMWVFHYWMNAHLGLGDFPSCDLDDPATTASVWGWSRCRAGLMPRMAPPTPVALMASMGVSGPKKVGPIVRFINRQTIHHTLASMLQFETYIKRISGNNGENGGKEDSSSSEMGDSDSAAPDNIAHFLTCRNNYIVSFDDIWVRLVAECCLRRELSAVKIRTPLWKH